MRCMACGSEKLSPPGVLLTGQGNVDAMWNLDGKSGWFSSGVVCRARYVVVCGDCGYFMLFASPETLAEAREKWSQLTTPTS